MLCDQQNFLAEVLVAFPQQQTTRATIFLFVQDHIRLICLHWEHQEFADWDQLSQIPVVYVEGLVAWDQHHLHRLHMLLHKDILKKKRTVSYSTLSRVSRGNIYFHHICNYQQTHNFQHKYENCHPLILLKLMNSLNCYSKVQLGNNMIARR